MVTVIENLSDFELDFQALCDYREGSNAPELIMDSCYIGTVWTHRLSVKETREINQFNRKLGGD